MLVKGDRIKQEKAICGFDYIGTVFEIAKITSDGTICFTNKRLGTGMMSHEEFAKHFVKTKWTDWNTMSDEHGLFKFRTDEKRVVVKRGEIKACASCNTMDKFNLHKGLQLALARLRVKEIMSNI